MFGNANLEIPESGDVTPPSRLLYPVSEVAVLLGISEKQVGRYIERKELRSRKLGRRRLVHRDDIEAFIRDHAAVDAA
ncbi:helix-turn-helix domain-containing protein [Micromonospora taraxaci]|uniref:helix-turn-helix domain-containing protein n=1 Tax=Micromonospora taraxaci TaxID=1316803 RepID=UPI0033DE9406